MATKILWIFIGYVALYSSSVWAMYWGWGLEIKDLAGFIVPHFFGTLAFLFCSLMTKLPEDE